MAPAFLGPFHLCQGPVSVLVDVVDGQLRIAHWGPAIGHVETDGLLDAIDRPAPEAEVDRLAPLALLPEAASGFARLPGVSGRRLDGSAWAPRLRITSVQLDEAPPGGGVALHARAEDPVAALGLDIAIRLAPSGVGQVEVGLTNLGDDVYHVDQVAISMPLPGQAREVMLLGGRWGNEFRPERHTWQAGTLVAENRRGRTSHDRKPTVFAGSPGFAEQSGEVWGLHLAWSGNGFVRVDTTTDGQRLVQAGELLSPGEVELAPGQRYAAPRVVYTASEAGLNGVSEAFHRFLRARPGHPRTPRPVVMNSWEAVYFDHSAERLIDLAQRAASVGVERFVLDDGWFAGRRSDSAGLGDWVVDESVWPDGLEPLIDRVVELGMQFGLWVEPEMVNEDSNLFRAHPDWVLHDPAYDLVGARNQLVLDLSRPEVYDYLRGAIGGLLDRYPISFLKWDLNRDLAAPTTGGRPGAHHQVRALYRLLDDLRAAHPEVEIESCASGGARADFEILERTDRIWVSDCNDALDRQRIQRGFSYLFPPELMGAHIGSPCDHLTGRRHRLDFRGVTAMFGHLGVEWDLTTASPDELAQLTRMIEVHKRWRGLLHDGQVVRLDHPDDAVLAHAVVAPDRSSALVSVAQIATADTLAVAPVRLDRLDPDQTYRVSLLELGEQRLGKAKYQPKWMSGELTVTGRQMATVGVQPPILDPQSAIVIALQAK